MLLLEAGPGLGGTSTWAGVNNWEPVAGPTGVAQELYGRLRRRPQAVALQRRRARHPTPGSWYEVSPETDYRLSLSRRRGLPIAFEPAALDEEMGALLESGTGCTIWRRSPFVDLRREGRRITALCVQRPRSRVWVRATDLHRRHGGHQPGPRRRLRHAPGPGDEGRVRRAGRPGAPPAPPQ